MYSRIWLLFQNILEVMTFIFGFYYFKAAISYYYLFIYFKGELSTKKIKGIF